MHELPMILSDLEMASLTTYATADGLSIDDAANRLFSEALTERFALNADKAKAKVYDIGAARAELPDKLATDVMPMLRDSEDGNAKA